MSISDLIVVMKLGVVQQIGKPQDVYDDPANLFVAKFLGTPPINVFKGYVEKGKLYLNSGAPAAKGAENMPEDDSIAQSVKEGVCVLDVPGIDDREVYVGIRPEGFVPNPRGRFKANLVNVEVMGRDVSVVCTHEASQNATVRAIVDADNKINEDRDSIAFSLKPHKVFIFDAETEERLRFEVK